MKQKKLQHVAIIGLPGSGKSTFSRELGEILNIFVHYLDLHRFDGNKKRENYEFLKIKEAIFKEESWIIEGCSLSTLEMRFSRADMVIYFNFSRFRCFWRIFKRFFTFNERITSTGCLKRVNWDLIKYIWNFDKKNRDGIEELRKKYPDVQFLVFHNSKDSEKYLEGLKRQNND